MKCFHVIFIATTFFQGQIFRIAFIFTLGWIDDIIYFEPMSVYIGFKLLYSLRMSVVILLFSHISFVLSFLCRFSTFLKTRNYISHLYSL